MNKYQRYDVHNSETLLLLEILDMLDVVELHDIEMVSDYGEADYWHAFIGVDEWDQ